MIADFIVLYVSTGLVTSNVASSVAFGSWTISTIPVTKYFPTSNKPLKIPSTTSKPVSTNDFSSSSSRRHISPSIVGVEMVNGGLHATSSAHPSVWKLISPKALIFKKTKTPVA